MDKDTEKRSTTPLRKEVDLEVAYVDNAGVKGIKKVHIAFISQAISEMYVALLTDLSDAVSLGTQVTQYTENVGYRMAKHNMNKDATKKQVVDELKSMQAEYERAAARLTTLAKELPDRKFQLIRKILVKNGIEDADMLSKEWWEDCVDSTDVMAFIADACRKDEELVARKKKVV